MTGMLGTSIGRRDVEPSCSAILLGHLEDAHRQDGLKLKTFGAALARAYNARVPAAVQALELIEPVLSMSPPDYSDAEGRLLKRVQRYRGGDYIPVELLDAWVDALCDVAPAHGARCGQAIAWRLGYMGAKPPVGAPAADGQILASFFHEVGGATSALTRALEDNDITIEDLRGGKLEAEVGELAAVLGSIQARIAQVRAEATA